MLTTLRKLRELRRNEKLSRAQLEAVKLAKFRELVRHVNRRSPYYAQIIKERGIRIDACTPADFPLLTKATLMANFDQVVTDRSITKQALVDFLTASTDPGELFRNRYHVIHTSGSSGEVGYFVYSKDDWARGMAQRLRRRSASARAPIKGFRRRRMAFYGAIGGHFAGVTMISSAKRGLSRLFVNVGLYEINSPLPLIIDQLNAFQPDFLSGYTTALKMLAAKQREGVLRLAPVMIGAAGEAMTQADQALLEEAFGCEVHGGYGCTEHLMMGFSVPGRSTMLLPDDDLIYEFHDDHVVTTNLFNFTLPLIRYRMSDILRPIAGSSSWPPYLEIDSLVGRNERVPLFKNRDGVEDFISPHTINETFVAGVTGFQMQLQGATRFRFVICLESALAAAQRTAAVAGIEARLREILDQKLMNNVSFEVTVVADLPVNPRTRKFQLIVDAPA
jgi:phenylacetate-coenzyme A ligase PaaK-like adenylate-forming protein